MAKSFFGRVLSFIGLEAAEDEEIREEEVSAEVDLEDVQTAAALDGSRRRGSVVAIAPAKAMRVVVVEPATFDEVQAIALNLRNRRPVIVNLERTEREVARRIVDFLSGATYALGGAMQRVGGAIFLFAPQNVDVAAQTTPGDTDGPGGALWSPK